MLPSWIRIRRTMPPSRCWIVLRLPSGATTAGAMAAPASGAVAAQPPRPAKKDKAMAVPASRGTRSDVRGPGRVIVLILDRVGSGGTRGADQGWQHRFPGAEAADLSVLEHQHLVGALQGLWAVRDQNDGGPRLLEPGQRRGQRRLARPIQMGAGLVEDEQT